MAVTAIKVWPTGRVPARMRSVQDGSEQQVAAVTSLAWL